MSDRIAPEVHLDHVHAHAVCQGIGERLRDSLRNDWIEPQHNLKELFARLPELDLESTPSIVPLKSDR